MAMNEFIFRAPPPIPPGGTFIYTQQSTREEGAELQERKVQGDRPQRSKHPKVVKPPGDK